MSAAHETHAGAGHGSLKTYVTGLVLAVLLTVVPFMLIMTGAFSPSWLAFIALTFAVVQIFVHLVYFLHMDGSSEQSWTLMSLIFTIVVVVFVVIGSLWIMHHLDTNMMPTMPASPETEMPDMPNMQHMEHGTTGAE
jgi:cytochrome o ubiquinol oxidase operon protein cyoD